MRPAGPPGATGRILGPAASPSEARLRELAATAVITEARPGQCHHSGITAMMGRPYESVTEGPDDGDMAAPQGAGGTSI
jgi:hypothetical protein